MFKLIAIIALAISGANAIGEGTLDMNAFRGIFEGVGKMFDPVKTEDIAESRLIGRWHQMYKAAINFDVFRTQMFCPVSYFKQNPVMGKGGFTIEEAYRVVSKNGPIETYKRDVVRSGPATYWMYTEEYFYPSQFIIIEAGPHIEGENVTLENEAIDDPETNTTLAEDVVENKVVPYDYIIATDANRLRLEVYARDPAQFYQKYNQHVLDFVKEKGFGGGSFWNSPQPIYQGPDCQWPNEREVFARRVLRNQQQGRGADANSGLGGSLLAGLNPQAALTTFQGLFGQRAIQPQPTAFAAQNGFAQTQPTFNNQPQSLFLNNNNVGQRL